MKKDEGIVPSSFLSGKLPGNTGALGGGHCHDCRIGYKEEARINGKLIRLLAARINVRRDRHINENNGS